ncbi:MAG: hypothetical protein K0S41_1999 [Anaerocolumna sp.]|jgi:hypothetical protein|nr:hypothetical protein [Anaerocolumna sp.]
MKRRFFSFDLFRFAKLTNTCILCYLVIKNILLIRKIYFMNDYIHRIKYDFTMKNIHEINKIDL